MTRNDMFAVVLQHIDKRIIGLKNLPVEIPQTDSDDIRVHQSPDLRFTILKPTIEGVSLCDGEEPTRRSALRSEFTKEEWRLVNELADHPNRLLVTATPEGGETYAEVAHETIFRRWGKLRDWIATEHVFLAWRSGLEAARRAWQADASDEGNLLRGGPLSVAKDWLTQRRDDLSSAEADFIDASITVDKMRRRKVLRTRGNISVLSMAAVLWLAYAGWLRLPYLKAYSHVLLDFISPKVLAGEEERALALITEKRPFQECTDCPSMVVVPAGSYRMGATEGEVPLLDQERKDKEYVGERPMHDVTIANAFAVSKYEITFDEWDACYMLGGCEHQLGDEGWGRGRRPAINLDWNDARQYVAWLSKTTGKHYRLLTEAEWEYAARAGTKTAFSWGGGVGKGNANCDRCGSKWDNDRTAEVGSFEANAFGLHDMHGNVWELVEDCYKDNYEDAPSDGSAVMIPDCPRHVIRGGSWYNHPINVRSAMRYYYVPGSRPENALADAKANTIGFRVARTLFLMLTEGREAKLAVAKATRPSEPTEPAGRSSRGAL